MRTYLEFIEQAQLVGDVTTTLTTGDLEYPGTALEIDGSDGEELFHVVIDSKGEQQLLFFSHGDNYRIPLCLMEQILVAAREKVRKMDE